MIQETLITLGWRQWLLISMMTPGKFSANSNYRSVKKSANKIYILDLFNEVDATV